MPDLQQFSAFDYTTVPRLDLDNLPAGLRQYKQDLLQFTEEELHFLRWRMMWKGLAREKQLPPTEFEDYTKTIWGIRSGRGFGKTLAAANWIGGEAAETRGIFAVVAPTHDDVRYTCFEGPTGLYSVIPHILIADTNSVLPSCTLWNGSFIRGFAGDTPERLRGPQHHKAWCDEIASWKYPQEAWDNLWFGLRLGDHPQVLWTGTPKPTPFMRRLDKDPNSVTVTGSTYENRENLTQAFYDNVAKYEGTKVGRQELWGEILDPEEEGIVRRSQWKLWPSKKPLPKFQVIVMSLDTAYGEKQHDKKKQESDPTACSVWGLFELGGKKVEHQLQPVGGEKNVMLLDCWEEWLGLPALIKRIKRERKLTYGDQDEPILKPRGIRAKHRAKHQGKRVDIILIEEKASGVSLMQSLAVEDILTSGYNPGNADKLTRLHLTSPMWAHGRVWAVESENAPKEPRTWADPLITQVCSYIGENSIERDDLCDTATQAMKMFMDNYIGPLTIKIDPVEAKRQEARRRADKAKKRIKGSNPYDG
jgi:hypothetical protein